MFPPDKGKPRSHSSSVVSSSVVSSDSTSSTLSVGNILLSLTASKRDLLVYSAAFGVCGWLLHRGYWKRKSRAGHCKSAERIKLLDAAQSRLNARIGASAIVGTGASRKPVTVTNAPRVEVQYIDDWQQCQQTMAELLLRKPALVGIDGEWQPTRKKGQKANAQLDVLQICSENCCFVIHLSHLMKKKAAATRTLAQCTKTKSGVQTTATSMGPSNAQCTTVNRLPPALECLLEDARVVKCGVGVRTDAQVLRRSNHTQLTSFLDVRYLVATDPWLRGTLSKEVILPSDVKLNLKRLACVYCDVTLEKGYRSAQCSDWNRWPLSAQQLEYAAMDAFVSRTIALSVLQRRQMRRSAECKERVSEGLFQALGRKCFGTGQFQADFSDETLRGFFEEFSRHFNRDFKPPIWIKTAFNKANAYVKWKQQMESGKSPKRKSAKRKRDKHSKDSSDRSLSSIVPLTTMASKTPSASTRSPPVFVESSAKDERWRFLMCGPDSRFISKIQRNKALFYLANGMAVLTCVEPCSRRVVVQITWTLSRYGHPGNDHYLMAACVGCGLSGMAADLIRHQIVPREYRRHMPAAIRSALSHDVIPLCLDCKQIAEQHNSRYKLEVVSTRYAAVAADTRNTDEVLAEMLADSGERKSLSEKEKRYLAKNAFILMQNADKLPQQRKDELLTPLRECFGVELVTDAHLAMARRMGAGRKHGDVVCEKILKEPKALYAFIVGWRTHFVESLSLAKLAPDWLQSANRQLADVMKV